MGFSRLWSFTPHGSNVWGLDLLHWCYYSLLAEHQWDSGLPFHSALCFALAALNWLNRCPCEGQQGLMLEG